MDPEAREQIESLTAHVASLESAVEVLTRDLIHDALTGLKTRAFFEEEARTYVSIAQTDRGSRREWFGFKNVSFLFLDIDYFKKVNDTLGHAAGDEALKAVAETVRLSVREGDTAARWGGEEIAVILVGATERDAVHKAEDIRRQVESIKFAKYPDLHLTISSGVASAESGATFDDIIKRADKALYKAKESGRNKVVAYSSIA